MSSEAYRHEMLAMEPGHNLERQNLDKQTLRPVLGKACERERKSCIKHKQERNSLGKGDCLGTPKLGGEYPRSSWPGELTAARLISERGPEGRHKTGKIDSRARRIHVDPSTTTAWDKGEEAHHPTSPELDKKGEPMNKARRTPSDMSFRLELRRGGVQGSQNQLAQGEKRICYQHKLKHNRRREGLSGGNGRASKAENLSI